MNNEQNQIQWILQEKYHGRRSAGLKKDILRLKRGEPLDYIIGFTDFLGCKIDASKRVLIPRVETQYWTEEAISQMPVASSQLRVLDMFAGSGCIGVAVLKHVKNAKVVFADSEKDTLAQIKINTKLNKIPKTRYKIVKSDIFSNIKGGPALSRAEGFDYIFANPPYIPLAQKKKIQKSVISYEPKAALFGGQDGLFYIKIFLSQAQDFLKPGGQIFMEFDVTHKNKIEKLLKKYNYKNWEFHKDQYRRWRWVSISV